MNFHNKDEILPIEAEKLPRYKPAKYLETPLQAAKHNELLDKSSVLTNFRRATITNRQNGQSTNNLRRHTQSDENVFLLKLEHT